jgi:hypothetical protein
VKYAIAAAVPVLVVAGAVLFWQQRAHAKPKLTDRDVLVVADFDNKTGDPVFDTALKQALAFQLQESPFLKAMSRRGRPRMARTAAVGAETGSPDSSAWPAMS